MRKLFALIVSITVLMLFGTGAYALDRLDPTFDVMPFLMDVGPATADADALSNDDIDKTEYTYTLETATGPLERYSAVQRFSKPVALLGTVAHTGLRLNLKIPWQYWQA